MATPIFDTLVAVGDRDPTSRPAAVPVPRPVPVPDASPAPAATWPRGPRPAGAPARPTDAAEVAEAARSASPARTVAPAHGGDRAAHGAGVRVRVRLCVPAVWVATLAEQEALELGHPRVGTEHLLLAMVRRGDAVGRRLAAHGVTLGVLRRTIVRSARPDPDAMIAEATGAVPGRAGAHRGPAVRPPWSTLASAAVEAARARAGADGRDEVGAGDLAAHLLVPGGRAADMLRRLGVDPEVLADPPGPVALPAGSTLSASGPLVRVAPPAPGDSLDDAAAATAPGADAPAGRGVPAARIPVRRTWVGIARVG